MLTNRCLNRGCIKKCCAGGPTAEGAGIAALSVLLAREQTRVNDTQLYRQRGDLRGRYVARSRQGCKAGKKKEVADYDWWERKESLDDVPNTKSRHREPGWKTLSPSVTLDRFPSRAPSAPYTSIPPIYHAITAMETIGSLGPIGIIHRLSKIEPRTSIRVHSFAFHPWYPRLCTTYSRISASQKQSTFFISKLFSSVGCF